MPKKFADTPSKRLFKIAGMGARVAGKVGSSRLRESFSGRDNASRAELYEAVGDDLLATLGEMKGAAMKVGQIASQLRHLFPEEISKKLAELQKNSPPMPIKVIRKQFQKALGFLPEQLFASFDEKPFAAASIGQVHRARLRDGSEVIVKIQYPGVAKSCHSDLLHLKRIFSLSGLLKVDKKALDEVFAEVEENLLRELDYRQEAKNLKRFAAFHAPNKNVVIPKVFDDFSAEEVLTLSYEPGDHADELKAKNYPQSLINALGETLILAIASEALELGEAHGDPHPGNFGFRPDGTVVIYDYGAVAKIRYSVIDQYIDIVEAALAGEFEKIDALFIRLGLRVEGAPEVASETYQRWHEKFTVAVLEQNNFEQLMLQLKQGIEQEMPNFMALRQAFKPCANTIFINRIAAGHLLNLAQMGAKFDIKPLVLELLFDDEEH